MRNYFTPRGLIVTASVSGDKNVVDKTYEVEKITGSLEFVSIWSYNLHSSIHGFTTHHTDTNPNGLTYQDNVYNSINHWLRRGANSRKIVMGISASGKTFALQEPKHWELGSPVYRGGGSAGLFTQQKGMLAYYEICKTKWVSRHCTKSSDVRAPYGTDGKDFIAYDDPESVRHKIKNLVLKMNLKGFMIKSLDLDDFSNVCGGGRYPLVKAGRSATRKIDYFPFSCYDILYTTTTTTTPTTTTTTTRRPPTVITNTGITPPGKDSGKNDNNHNTARGNNNNDNSKHNNPRTNTQGKASSAVHVKAGITFISLVLLTSFFLY